MNSGAILTTDDKISKTINALKLNGFDVRFASNRARAKSIFWDEIYNKIKPQTVSWGDSLTLHSLDIIENFKHLKDIRLIETFGSHLTWRTQIYNRKKALSADMFLTGSNAITAKGHLVNLDMIGNRVAGITFGPRNVIIFVGINKIVGNLYEAISRIKTISAPMNAKAHTDLQIPCQTSGECSDCTSPQRMCNTWVITEKSYPIGRIKIILINEQLGF